jgi:tetratricopeptide (TPR) repeat protein
MATTDGKKENLSASDAIADFIQNNRKGLVVALAAIVILVVGFIAGVSILDVLRGKAISQVEDFTQRYEVLVIDINEPSKEGDVQSFLDELNAFGKSHSGYAGARAYALAASVYAEQKDWARAETAWASSARTAAKSYLAPVALFNAAVAAEEQGNLAQAISLYAESASHDADFSGAPRAQFSIGRLYEVQGDTEAALEAYRVISEKWASNPTWINLAQNRIIALENTGS